MPRRWTRANENKRGSERWAVQRSGQRSGLGVVGGRHARCEVASTARLSARDNDRVQSRGVTVDRRTDGQSDRVTF